MTLIEIVIKKGFLSSLDNILFLAESAVSPFCVYRYKKMWYVCQWELYIQVTICIKVTIIGQSTAINMDPWFCWTTYRSPKWLVKNNSKRKTNGLIYKKNQKRKTLMNHINKWQLLHNMFLKLKLINSKHRSNWNWGDISFTIIKLCFQLFLTKVEKDSLWLRCICHKCFCDIWLSSIVTPLMLSIFCTPEAYTYNHWINIVFTNEFNVIWKEKFSIKLM